MPKFNQQKNALIAGELSPKLDGRIDLPQYINGCKTLQNMIPLKQGGATKRPGTIASFSTLTGKVRMIPFIVSQTESYVILLGTGCNNGAGVYIGIAGVDVIQGSSHTIGKTAAASYYADADIDDVQFVQSVDTLYLVHPNYKPQRVIRNTLTAFALAPYDDLTGLQRVLRQPFRSQNLDTSKTMAPSVASGTGITITSSVAFFVNGHIGTLIKLTISGITGYAQITAVAGGGLTCTADVVINFGGTTAASDWEEQAWSSYRGYPKAITFSEGRLIYGGNASQPDTFWASKTNDYTIMMGRKFNQDVGVASVTGLAYFGDLVKPDDPLQYNTNSPRLNKIQWMSSTKTFAIGTFGAEHVVPRDQNPISPTNLTALKADTAHGSSAIQPVQVGKCLVFVQRSGRKLMEMDFDFYSESYTSEDLLFIADHLPGKATGIAAKLKQIAYQEDIQVIWCMDDAGGLFGCLRDKTMLITAWHSVVLGGRSAKVESIAVIPSRSGKVDQLWLVVSRLNNDLTTRSYFIEYMSGVFNDTSVTYSDPNAPYPFNPTHFRGSEGMPIFSDYSSFSFSGGPFVNPQQTGVACPFLLQSYVAMADGFAVSGTTDGSGVMALGGSFDRVVHGLPYTCVVQTMRVEAGAQTGQAQGQTKRIDRVVPRFNNTNHAKVGNSLTNLETLNFRDDSTPLSQSTPLYTGDMEVYYNGTYVLAGLVYIVSDLPLPFSVTSVAVRGTTYE